jgi:hypothetical protein
MKRREHDQNCELRKRQITSKSSMEKMKKTKDDKMSNKED